MGEKISTTSPQSPPPTLEGFDKEIDTYDTVREKEEYDKVSRILRPYVFFKIFVFL